MFSAKTTGPIFTTILHDIVALVALLNHAYTRRYPIPFLIARATNVGSLPFFHKIGCHGNFPWDIGKKGVDRSSVPKTLSFGEKTTKIGPANPEIICLGEIIKKEEEEKRKKKEINASFLSGLKKRKQSEKTINIRTNNIVNFLFASLSSCLFICSFMLPCFSIKDITINFGHITGSKKKSSSLANPSLTITHYCCINFTRYSDMWRY